MSTFHRFGTIPAIAMLAITLQLGAVSVSVGTGSDATAPTAADQPTHRIPAPIATSSATTTTPTATVPTTSTTLPPPPVPVAPPTTASPPPPPVAAPAPAPAASPAEHLQASFEASVPAAWRAVINVRLELIEGSTSWAWPSGRIQVGTSHLARGEDTLRTTLAHEFGHLIAYRYGTQAFHGAAPAGWPAYGTDPAEAWADCVARAFTGVDLPSHGLPSCAGAALSWTASWLAAGPSAHERSA